VADLKRQAQVPFPILIDADNGYAMSLNLTIWVGAEIQKMMKGRLDLLTFQGKSILDAPGPRDVRCRPGWAGQGALHRSGLRHRMMISDMLAAMFYQRANGANVGAQDRRARMPRGESGLRRFSPVSRRGGSNP
jgi:hypothetical protein